MTKKLLSLMGFVLLFMALTVNTPLVAQEDSEDIEDFSLEELLNVEITTAGKQAEKISEIPASVVLVTREDIEKYGYQSLVEILQNIPGLYMTDDYVSENFGVRGFWTVNPQRNMVILVNDVPQTEFLLNSNLLSHINVAPEAIDRIEVVRGPMSVIYGSGAFFGAINIKTNVVGDKPVSSVGAAFGSEKSTRVFARASGKEGDLTYAFNASFFNTDGMNNNYEDMGAFTGSTEGALENEERYFNFSGVFKGFTIDSSYSEAFKEISVVLPSVNEGTLIHAKALRFAFGYEKKFSDKAKGVAKFTYFRNYWTFDYDIAIPNLYGFQTNGAAGYKAELNFYFDPSDKLNITLGIEYNKVSDVTSDAHIPFFVLFDNYNGLAEDSSMVSQAIFTQFNYKLSNKLKLVLGARVEQVPEYTMEFLLGHADPTDPLFGTEDRVQATYSQTKAEFIPRVALIYSPNDNHYFKLLYGQAINRPSFFQSLELLTGSEPLSPETIQTLELNYIGNLSPKFQVSLSLFRNMLDNLIFRSLLVIGGEFVSVFDNVGEMTTNGVEFTITARPNKDFHLELSGTYQKTEDKLYNEEPGYSPKFLGYLKASYFFNDDVSLAVTGNYVGEMESFYDGSARLGEPVDGYFLLGANLRIRNLFGKGFFLNFRGSNLLDQEVHYPATSNNSFFATKGTIGRGLTFLATLGWKF